MKKTPRVLITLAIATFALGALIVSPAVGGPSLGKMVKKAVKKEVKKQIKDEEGPRGQQGLAGPQGPGGAPATALFAGVNSDGTLATQKGVVGTVSHVAASGSYTITFDRNVDACVPIATASEDDFNTEVAAFTQGGANNTVTALTSVADTLGDEGFNVAVLC